MKATMVSVVTVTPEDGVTVAELFAVIAARALAGQVVDVVDGSVTVTTEQAEVDI